ncbi:TIGR02594 family protein [Acidovorax sp. Q11]
MSNPLPSAYAWLNNEPGPRILTEFIKVFGTEEDKGPGSNPTILAWAKEVGLGKVYVDDATAWCGLAMAYVAGQAGWENTPRGNALLARNWQHWGTPAEVPMLGDVMVFWRGKRKGIKGHVGIYVGEDDGAYHVLGGNQAGDKVSIDRFARDRWLQARRCPWRINQPSNVRPIHLASTGKLSDNEA